MRAYRLALVGALVLSSSSYGKTSAREGSWQGEMGALSQTLQELLPELAAKKPDTGKLERVAKKLSTLAHSVHKAAGKSSPSVPDSDPSVTILSSLFEKQTKQAYEAMKAGHTEYSRRLLSSVAGYCIACHTRHDQGPSFTGTELGRGTESMEPIERAELLAATRQFDGAIEEYRKLLSSSSYAKAHPIDWERGLRDALAIAVRVKKDPRLSLELIDRVKALSDTPEFVKGYVDTWRRTLIEWRDEPTTKPVTEEGLEAQAAQLLSEARRLQKFPIDHGGDILYLRASAVAHDLLSRNPNGPRASRALLMEGMAYEVLNNPLVLPVHEMYYEACIRKSPHTKVAKECYERYEASVFFGYSGSGGMFLPPDVESTLGALKALAL